MFGRPQTALSCRDPEKEIQSPRTKWCYWVRRSRSLLFGMSCEASQAEWCEYTIQGNVLGLQLRGWLGTCVGPVQAGTEKSLRRELPADEAARPDRAISGAHAEPNSTACHCCCNRCRLCSCHIQRDVSSGGGAILGQPAWPMAHGPERQH